MVTFGGRQSDLLGHSFLPLEFHFLHSLFGRFEDLVVALDCESVLDGACATQL